jgi:SAM-dependent methyltransferase
VPGDLPQSISQAFERIRSSWPGLREAIPDERSLEFWIWANRHGLFVRPELRAILAPFPPADYLRAGSNDASEQQFASSGCNYYEHMERALNQLGRSWCDMQAVMDFGCGSGRVSRLFARHREHMRLYGADLNALPIGWLNDNLDFGNFYIGFAEPPMPFDDAVFDAIFSISVFSHLKARSQALWLREFHRLLKVGGILFQTVHGRHAMRLCEHYDVWRDALNIAPDSFSTLRRELLETGFSWVPHTIATGARDDYGISFQSEQYIRDTWCLGFELVGFWPGRIDDWQDLVALRRRPGPALRMNGECTPTPVLSVELMSLSNEPAVGRPLGFRATAFGGEDVHFKFYVGENGGPYRALTDWIPVSEVTYTPWASGKYVVLVHAESGPGPHARPRAQHGLKVIIE